MSNYGERIDLGGWEPEHDNVKDLFCSYFNNPVLTKIKDVDNTSVYACKIKSLLLNHKTRYIIVSVINDNEQKGATKMLSELDWISFQTRELESFMSCSEHTYKPIKTKYDINSYRINISNRNDTHCEYNCVNLPITITLLVNNVASGRQYQNTGTLVRAIETYQTIITWKY